MAAERILLLYRLREGIDPKRYERWLRQVERPLVARVGAIEAYAVTRLEEPDGGQRGLPYDYAEMLEVRSLEAYRTEMDGDPEVGRFLAEWEGYVDEYVVVQGFVVSEVRKARDP